MKNIKVSFVVTTFSNTEINELIKNISEQCYKNLEIIVVDCNNLLSEEKDFYFTNNIFVNIFKPKQITGYYEALKFGLMQATGELIAFITTDTCLCDRDFINRAVNKFCSDKNIDMVFGKTEISSSLGFSVKDYSFKDFYSSEEFLEEWEKLRMVFADYFDLSGFVFKKKLLFSAEAFSSNYVNALSLDASTLLKCAIISRKTAFIKTIAVKKKVKHPNKNSFNTKDLTEQITNHFAFSFDIKDFIKRKNITVCNIERFLNKYADYAINSIYFDYFSNFDNENFTMLLKSGILKGKKIYIYGKGWIGLALEKFLVKNNLRIEKFIDDYRTGDNIVDFETFINIYEKNSIVIIASYKYKDSYKIFKKLSKIKDIDITDLFFKEIG